MSSMPARERYPLRRAEYFAIFAFWSFFGLLWTANAALSPPSGRFVPQFPAAPAAVAFLTAYLWALLTPALFALASRLSLERGNWVWRALVLAGVALAVALGTDALLVYLRYTFFFERVANRGPPPDFLARTRRLWFANQFIIVGAILAAGYARSYFHRYQARQVEAVRLQGQLADARLAALRSQLDPHFLFNTLHAISALVERDPRGVRRMIARLSELLRSTLDGARDQEIALHEELRFLEGYLEIMQVRFQGRLTVATDIAAGLGEALVPNFVLQPLVENAIRHGVSKTDDAGHITISARRDGRDVRLRIEDNGPAPASADEVIVEGIGLGNTRERLEQLYGAAQHLVLERLPAGGMRAEVRLPFHTRADLRIAAV